MQVRDIMTERPTYCTPDTNLQEIAEKMIHFDCGAIPVIDPQTKKAIGIVTDRDIVCRAVAKGHNPLNMRVDQVMSRPINSIGPDSSIKQCLAAMESAQLRRMLVVDDRGLICGMVSQADIARTAPEHQTAELVKDVSQPAQSQPAP